MRNVEPKIKYVIEQWGNAYNKASKVWMRVEIGTWDKVSTLSGRLRSKISYEVRGRDEKRRA